MIIKVQYSRAANKIYITSKPSHSGRDRQHSVYFEDTPTKELLVKMQGKDTAFFHAHKNQDSLVIDDKIEDQRW